MVGFLTLLLSATWTCPVQGADINKGYSFAPGEKNITNAKLNNQIDLATIDTSFYTGKAATTTPVAADTILLYSASAAGFRKCSLDNLLFSNTSFLTGLAEDDLPATNDFLLSYDTSATGFKKVPFSAIWTNSDLINTRSNWTAPGPTSFVLGYDGGSGLHYKFSISNLFYNFAGFSYFTNLADCNVLNSQHKLLIWDSNFGTNRTTTLGGLLSNTVVAGVLDSNGWLWGYTNGSPAPRKFTAADIQKYVTNAVNSPSLVQQTALPTKYVATNTIGAAADTIVFTHGLAGIPQSVRVSLLCTNADAATQYAVGEEIPLAYTTSVSGSPVAAEIITATTIELIFNSSSTFQLLHRATGVLTSVTSRNNFRIKVTAVFFP